MCAAGGEGVGWGPRAADGLTHCPQTCRNVGVQLWARPLVNAEDRSLLISSALGRILSIDCKLTRA